MAAVKVEVSAFACAPMKIEMKTGDCTTDGNNTKVKMEDLVSDSQNAVITQPQKRIYGPSPRPSKHSFVKAVLHEHRCRLVRLIKKLARRHDWQNASGALSVLLKGTPHGCPVMDDRKNFLVAMELLSRFRDTQNYSTKIKQIYEVWMNKLAWTRKCCKKKHLLQLELALFCLTQGNIREAHHTIKFLVQDRESASEPNVHLIHGLTSYQLWYSELPKEMQLKDSDVFVPLEISGLACSDDFDLEIGSVENSDDHNAVDIQDVEFSAQYNSESSVGNDNKVLMNCNAPRKQPRQVFCAHEFYIDGSAGTNEIRIPSPNLVNNLGYNSIFLPRELDASLLPIRLQQSTEHLEQSIQSHRRLVNEHYMDALKHLRIALYSNPPSLSALHPLIQLLLLGDRVEEALTELEKFYHISKTALASRYRARLLECFCGNQYGELSKCYENELKTEPTSVYALQRLIRMHRNGNYGTIPLLEMIALHLDTTNGKCSTWGEFASCLLKLQTALQSEYEQDQMSTNGPKIYKYTNLASIFPSSTNPKAFLKGEARRSWILRCNWWSKRHFNKGIYRSEMQTGDWQLLTSKAACACHLYGPRLQYVRDVLTSLRMEGDSNCISFLGTHIENPLKLLETLT